MIMIDINSIPIKQGVIVGSYCIHEKYNDIDIICYEKDIECDYTVNNYMATFYCPVNEVRIECLLADEFESLQIMYKRHLVCNSITIANYNTCFILKAGHIWYENKKWRKHIEDYHYLKNYIQYYKSNNKGSEIYYENYTIDDMIKIQKQTTEQIQGKQKLPNLNMAKDKFFDDNVKKYIDHDLLHIIFAHRDDRIPIYTLMQKENDEVLCSKKLWNKLTFDEKCQAVLEEAYVIASERHIIPQLVKNSKEYYARYAFMWALMRICTTLTSGFFRDFAINNYKHILTMYNSNYYTKLFNLNYKL